MNHRYTLPAFVVFVFIMMFSTLVSAQILPPGHPSIARQYLNENTELVSPAEQPTTPSVSMGYARYTVKDWGTLIDSTWGPGLPTDQKLQIFDDFWSNIDKYHGGFVNNSLNWDSLRNLYRPEIAQGVSRGRFGAIITHMSAALHETHTWIYDDGMDGAMVTGGYFRPRGVPMIILGGVGRCGLGVSLTPLPDSSLLVIQAQANHPLGLIAGDVVVGYDRVPWKQLVRQLFEAQLPISVGYSSIWGSSSESWTHILLTSAANNWHLFDSLDVVKYSSGDTVHISVSSLTGWTWDKLKAVEQLPVKGVPFPVYNVDPCTGGVVEGTNIGYIYIRNWWSPGIDKRIISVIDSLTKKLNVNGLIVDFRFNGGGDPNLLASLGALFNGDPYQWYSNASRTSTTDRMAFNVVPTGMTIAPKDQLFDHPIAVLTGPECLSSGDAGAFFMRSHPMARFFGKPTNMAYVVEVQSGSYPGSIYYQYSTGSEYSNYPGESYLLHKGFDVDEKVWFTKDDVANGDDSIVKRALEWIAGLAYAHDATLSKVAAKPGQDSIKITTTVENPQNHTLKIWSYVTGSEGGLVDSCQMFDDGLHGDGAAGDKIFGGSFQAPAKEGKYHVSSRTTDITTGTYRHLTNAKKFFTNGPVISKGWVSATADTIPNPGDVLTLGFVLRNCGATDTIKTVTVRLCPLDTMASIDTAVTLSYGNLAPGIETAGTKRLDLKIRSTCPPNTTVRLLLNIFTEGIQVWSDTVSLHVVAPATNILAGVSLPTEFSLGQNYPNPFNPTTTIRFDLPERSSVRLTIFNVLGQRVAELINGELNAGYCQKAWNASVASGLYFYRIEAVSMTNPNNRFVDVKKMILLK